MSPQRRHPAKLARVPLQKRVRAGFHGYPAATLAYYGPDDQFASKVVVGLILEEGGDATVLAKWFAQDQDVRIDPAIGQQLVELTKQHQVKSVVMMDRIIGCPHEEGKDYPMGETCPQCPFWANRDRWTGEFLAPEPTVAVVTSCAWYRPDQWERLLEVSADRDDLEETYEEWVTNAEQSLRELSRQGMHIEKVDVDVEELVAWCRKQGREVDGAARASYAAEKMQRYVQSIKDGG